MAFDIEMIEKVYASMATRVDKARELVGRPLTLTEKILRTKFFSKNRPTVLMRYNKGTRNDLTSSDRTQATHANGSYLWHSCRPLFCSYEFNDKTYW